MSILYINLKDNAKQNLHFSIGNVYSRQMKYVTPELSPHWGLACPYETSLSTCPGQDGQSQVLTAAFKQGQFSSRWKEKNVFVFFFVVVVVFFFVLLIFV